MKKSIIILLIILQTGCGTAVSCIEGKIGVYSGVKKDIEQSEYHRSYHDSFAELIVICDIPLSFIADTINLPFSGFLYSK